MNQGADPDDCRANGGTPTYRDIPGPMLYDAGVSSGHQTTIRVWACSLPAGGARGAGSGAGVQTQTSLTTQVSPQISPVFVQQSNPSNSPVGAAPSRTDAYTGGTTGPSAEYLDYLKSRDEAQAANDAAILDAMRASVSPGGGSPAPQPSTVVEVPAPSTAQAPASSTTGELARMIPWIALAGFGITVFSNTKRNSARRTHRRKRG